MGHVSQASGNLLRVLVVLRCDLLEHSSSFPIAINPDVDLGFSGMRAYQDQMAAVAADLADAKVAVYPMDPAGLHAQSMFEASTRMRGNPVTGQHSIGRQLNREDQSRFNRQQAMEVLADETGGIVCVNNNDLGTACGRPSMTAVL